jgi:hypothetical protein
MVLEDSFRATSKMTEVNERSEVNFSVILRIPSSEARREKHCGNVKLGNWVIEKSVRTNSAISQFPNFTIRRGNTKCLGLPLRCSASDLSIESKRLRTSRNSNFSRSFG